MQAGLALIATLVLIVPLSLAFALWLVIRLRRKTDRPIFADAAGSTVPVRRLMRTGAMSGRSENALDPQLQLLADGVAFQVFKADVWPFVEIAEVDAPWAPFGTRLSLRHGSGARLTIDLADRAQARALLGALPSDLAFTRRAINIRDWPG